LARFEKKLITPGEGPTTKNPKKIRGDQTTSPSDTNKKINAGQKKGNWEGIKGGDEKGKSAGTKGGTKRGRVRKKTLFSMAYKRNKKTKRKGHRGKPKGKENEGNSYCKNLGEKVETLGSAKTKVGKDKKHVHAPANHRVLKKPLERETKISQTNNRDMGEKGAWVERGANGKGDREGGGGGSWPAETFRRSCR